MMERQQQALNRESSHHSAGSVEDGLGSKRVQKKEDPHRSPGERSQGPELRWLRGGGGQRMAT